MALSSDELNGVIAQWQEWVPDGFGLSIEVREDDISRPGAVMIDSKRLGARIRSAALYLQVQIRRGDTLVFDEPCPYDAAALRASVTTLARTIAESQQRDDRV